MKISSKKVLNNEMKNNDIDLKAKKQIVNNAYTYFLSNSVKKDLYICIYRSLASFLKRQSSNGYNFDKKKFLKIEELKGNKLYYDIKSRALYTYKIFLHNFFENYILDIENNEIKKTIEILYFLKKQDIIEDMFFNQFKKKLSDEYFEQYIMKDLEKIHLIFLINYKTDFNKERIYNFKKVEKNNLCKSKIHNKFILITSIKEQINEKNFQIILNDMEKLKKNYSDISNEDLVSYMKSNLFLDRCNNNIKRKIKNNTFILKEI